MRTVVIIFLVIIVVMSLFYLGYNQPKKEAFVDSSDTLNQLSNLMQNIVSNKSISESTSNVELQNQLKTLSSALQVLITQNNINSKSSVDSQGETILPEMNALNNAQLVQMKQDVAINELKRRLANLQKVYASYLQKQSESAVKYDKIPVYSSCIVSEADGRYTFPTQSA